MRTLVIDIGGSSVKVWSPGGEALEKVPTGPEFTPQHMIEEIEHIAKSDDYDVVSVGYPGKLVAGQPQRDPWNLGPGWVAFDFPAHFPKPLRMMNDAAMQALGSYRGGRMLFVGLGTSVGSTLIVDNVVIPLELGAVPHTFGKTLEHLLAREALEKLGKRKWRHAVLDCLPRLQSAFMADYVVLGGGNAKKLRHRLPPEVSLGSNFNAFRGGCRLWDCEDLQSVQIYKGDAKAEFAEAQDRPRLASGDNPPEEQARVKHG